ncbi:MAG: dTMP kinase [Ilumatobacteraceae bacterium]|nr:dTMP kinase [Ilumatobacteraceae bacterium]
MPFYIAFEGAEACGKSTHAARLAEHLDAVITRETGGTAIGRRLREILHDTSVTDLDDHAETLIVAADRAQHLAEVVRPALAAGRHVVSDRSVYSTLAYQGYGRGLPLEQVRLINEWAIGETWPDLVILLTVPDDVTARRMAKRDRDRFELAGDDFHGRVDRGFATMASDDPDHWVVIDASGDPDDVTAAIRDAVRDRLGVG